MLNLKIRLFNVVNIKIFGYLEVWRASHLKLTAVVTWLPKPVLKPLIISSSRNCYFRIALPHKTNQYQSSGTVFHLHWNFIVINFVLLISGKISPFIFTIPSDSYRLTEVTEKGRFAAFLENSMPLISSLETLQNIRLEAYNYT